MKMKLLLVALALSFSGGVSWSQTQPASPSSQPINLATQPIGELMQSKSSMVGYGAEKYRLVDQKDEIVSVLANGMTVIVKRIPSPVVAVRGVIGTGGVYEGKWLGGGLSHLLEHLVAGGSNDRRTEAENKNLLQQIGNNSNANTTEDRTAFFVNTTPPHLEQAIDLVTGWVLGAQITVPEYRREFQVVQRELEMGKGSPDRVFYYLSQMNRYRVNPARVPTIGYQEVIQGLSRDDVYNYYKLAYEPGNMIFSVVGDLDPEMMLKTLRKYVADAKPQRVFSHDIPAEPPVLSPRTVVATFPKLGQARLLLGFPSVKLTNPDMYALDLLATILGSGDSSMLVEELRDKKQLVSGIAAEDDTPVYAEGTFGIDMALDAENVQPATKAVLELLEGLKTNWISEDRIARAKTQMRVARVKALEKAEDIADALAEDFRTTGDPNFQDRYLEQVQKVSAAQLQDVARRYLDSSRLLTTLLLPAEAVGTQGLAKAEDLIRPVVPAPAQPTTNEVAGEIQRVELDNGVILLLKRISSSPLVVMNMYSLGGVTVEDASTNGLGNLTMELLPRGTTTRSAQQIAEFFDSVGGALQTVTGNNTWYWTASCLKADFEKTLEVYSDVVTNPSFPDKEIGPMKQRIAAAIAGEDADWTSQTIRFFKATYFGASGNPYQFLPIGTQENIQKFTVAQVRDWYTKKILNGRRVLAIFGDIDVEQAKTLAAKYLGGGTRLTNISPPRPSYAAAPAFSGPPSVDVEDVKVQKTEQALAGVMIGYKADSLIGDPADYTLSVAQTMAGGWNYPTGYLFETLRGKGLVYVVENQNIPGRSSATPGTYMALAGCDPSKVNEVVDQILLNIARLQGSATDMQEDWFSRSKLLITTADAMDHETPAEQASTAALDELLGLGFDYHNQFADQINAVTMDQIRQIAAARLRKCVVTISTPDPDAVNIKTGLQTFSSFPPVDLTPRGVQHGADVGKP